MRKTVAERFWAKVDGGSVDTCWVWTAGKVSGGYGHFWLGPSHVRAHRWAYEALRAEIPAGLQLDHLCRNRACVNAWHLEPVTAKVNVRRGDTGKHARIQAEKATECGFGHPWTPENTYVTPSSGARLCRQCMTIRELRRTKRKAATERREARRARRCSVPGCGRAWSSKGYCAMHAERVRRNGTPGTPTPVRVWRRAS